MPHIFEKKHFCFTPKKIISLTLIFFTNFLIAQTGPILEWVRTDSSSGNEEGRSIAVDSKGSVYTTGFFSGVADFDPGAGTYSLSSVGSWDIFVSKLDSSGNFLWAKQFGSINDDQGLSIEVDTAGNVYTTGYFMNTVDFDPGPGNYSLTSFGQGDIFVSKLTTAGNFIWAKQLGGTYHESGSAVEVDLNGNVFITGFFGGVPDFDPGPSAYTLSVSGFATDAFVCELDSSGNFVMAKQTNATAYCAGNAIALDTAGNIYVTGKYLYTTDFDPSPASYTLTSNGSYDLFILKLDPLGNFLWAVTAGGLSQDDVGTSIDLDSAGNVYTSGYFRGSVDFDPGPGIFNLNSGSCSDGFVWKLNPSGNLIWAKNLGGNGNEIDEGYGIKMDQNGNSYVTGRLGAYGVFGSYVVHGSGGQNIFIVKLDPLGNFLWAKVLDNGYGRSIDVDVNGKVYTTGWYSGTTDFDPNIGQSLSTSNLNTWEIFIHKMSLCTIPPMAINTTQSIDANVCAGNSATLSASGSGTIAWFSYGPTPVGFGNTFVTPSNLGPSTPYYYATAYTCIQSDFLTAIGFTVNPRPTITVNTGSICEGQSFTITPSGASTYTIEGGSAIVSPSVTSSYTVVGTNSLGCVSSTPATLNLTVNPTPTITVNSGTICSGNSFTISPNGASTYTVQGGNNIVNPISNTSYTVSGTSTAGCLGANIATSNVTVLSSPTITANSTSTNYICAGQNATLTASGATTYTWNTSSTNTAIVVSPTTTTNYSVIGTDINGCTNTATLTQNVSACTEIKEIAEKSDLSVFPNPSNGVFTLNLNDLSSKTFFEVYNPHGQLLLIENLGSKQTTVDISEFENGLYLLLVKKENQILKAVKIIKD